LVNEEAANSLQLEKHALLLAGKQVLQFGGELRNPRGKTNGFSRPTRPLLASEVREMSTGQSAVLLCGWAVKAGWLIPFVDRRVGDM